MNQCRLSGNSAGAGGGAVSSSLRNCALLGNSVTNDGGGALNSFLKNCTIVGNSAASAGGVSEGVLKNCIV